MKTLSAHGVITGGGWSHVYALTWTIIRPVFTISHCFHYDDMTREQRQPLTNRHGISMLTGFTRGITTAPRRSSCSLSAKTLIISDNRLLATLACRLAVIGGVIGRAPHCHTGVTSRLLWRLVAILYDVSVIIQHRYNDTGIGWFNE